MGREGTERVRAALRWLLAAGMVAIGIAHFLVPEPFVRIVPPSLPLPETLVLVSGACEVLGGLGLLVRPVRRFAGWGLVALYVAVFPANVYQAVERVPLEEGGTISPVVLWARLPFQALFILWAWWVSRPPASDTHPDADR